MEICLSQKCTGCYACANICPRHCIKMDEDEDGAVRPHIDKSNCVECRLCMSVCPNNVKIDFRYPTKCYAAWINDSEERRICASGGIATAMAKYAIRHGGVMFGSRYDDHLNPVMSHTEKMEDLDYFKGSRYVQSLVGNRTYSEAKAYLKKDRLVLFIGTPCQIAGLYAFLKKDYNNLITVDLICHGTCPTKYLKDEINYLSNKYHIQEISDIRFRGNDGNNFFLTLWDKDRKKLFPRNNYFFKKFHIDNNQQFYIQGFLRGVSLRENCYSCNYAKPSRISDITIGDFIGLGKERPFTPKVNNVSSIMINTEKGQCFYNKVSEQDTTLHSEERNYTERLLYKPSLEFPYPRHIKNTEFSQYYKTLGFPRAIRKTLKAELRKERLHLLLSKLLRIHHIPQKIYRIISYKPQ